MKRQLKYIVIFTSCSPELKKEQIALWEILEELKTVWKQKRGISLIFNTHQEASLDPTIIKYDIFIGVIWTHFSPSSYPHGSGTFDDFHKAYQRYLQPNPAKVIFFVKDYPLPPSKIDAERLCQFKKFITPLKDKKGLCSYYYDRDEFCNSVKQYLNRQIAFISNRGDSKRENQKPLRDISHVLYRITNNTDTLEEYLIKLTRLLNLYFKCATSKAFFLDKQTSKLRYVAMFNGKKSVLLKSREDFGAISNEEEKLIKGNVISHPRIIGHPLIFNSLLGGLVVKRNPSQESFQSYHRQLLSFIAEQSALSAEYYTKIGMYKA